MGYAYITIYIIYWNSYQHFYIHIFQCREEDQREVAAATDRRKMVLFASDGGIGGSGDRGDKEVCHNKEEHGCKIYFNANHSETL